jgi:hypothetical protein
MTRLHNYLTERISDLSLDVNHIYDMYFAKLVKAVQTKNGRELDIILNYSGGSVKDTTFAEFDSSVLKSHDCVEAHKIIPVTIYVGVFDTGSLYDFKSQIIHISANTNALNFLLSNNFNLDILANKFQKDSIMLEIDEVSLKGTISHELLHWIDDALHGKHLTKNLSPYTGKTAELVAKIYTKGKSNHIGTTSFEMNAQVQAIMEIRKSMNVEKYDMLTFVDIYKLKPSIGFIVQQLKSEEYTIYMRKLISRLNREGILGKSMKFLPHKNLRQVFA